MTNNPTIDGVSRELIERAISATMLARGPGSPTERDLRALLDAPVVEFQPVACGQCGSTSADICNGNGCGYLESGNGEPELAALQSTIAQLQARVAELESGRGEPVTMDGKTTVREYVADSVPEDQIGDDWTKGYEECKRRIHRMFQQPVNANARFTAPPAPAAVVLPERMEPPSDYAYRKGWNACLDATAALNEVKA